MAPRNYYQILDLDEDATTQDIKNAYRRLARKYHPDVSRAGDAEERFKEVLQAYETLKDPCRRSAYDLFGCFGAGRSSRAPDWERQFREFFARDDDTATSGRDGPFGLFRSRTDRQGHDIAVSAHITVEEAARGVEASLELPPSRAGGTPAGTRRRTLRVWIPKGSVDGQTIKLPGQGHPDPSGTSAGDLYVTVALRPHPLFRVDGRDLTLDLPVTPWEAALGATLEVPTLDGRVRLRLPPGTPSEQRLRLAGRGLPSAEGGAGDLFVRVAIVTPSVLSEQERQLYAELARVSSFEPRSHLA